MIATEKVGTRRIIHLTSISTFSDLRRLYTLLKRVPKGLTTITECVSKYLRQKGEYLVNENTEGDSGSAKNPIAYIQVSVFDVKVNYFLRQNTFS